MAPGPFTRILFRTSSDAGSTPTAREKWTSRTSFVLASMGGAVGIGNLLRYPSIVARHSGIQWFVPYLLALFFIGIPLLLLEIAIGQTFRGGAVVAYTAINRRLRGVGLSTSYIAFVTATYYVVIMAWVLVYFRNSFIRPLPWLENNELFFDKNVTRNEPSQTTLAGFNYYPNVAVIGETLGWAVLSWLFVYLCLFRGVSLTGRIVYVTMLLPLILCIALIVRAVTLPRAGNGVKLYVGEWHTDKLRTGAIWQDAAIQIFFSIGTGFAVFIAYASYNVPQANPVQDALIIALSNSLIEVVVGFAAFAVIGNLRLDLTQKRLTSFSIGFITYPTALARLPGSNAWAAVFFLIVYLLAIDSAFALIESFATVVTDSDWGDRLRKPVAVGGVVLLAMLLNFMYCTEFGLWLMDAVDKWITGIALMFTSWIQCVAVTGFYRYKDVISQTGIAAFAIAQGTYIGSMVLGVIVGHTVSPGAGVGIFVAVLVAGFVVAPLVSKRPEVIGPWGGNKYVNAFYWLTSYAANQLTLDLNVVVARGRNWSIPFFWAPVLRWITAPVLITMLSYSYSIFYKDAKDPLHIFSFVISHLAVVFAVVGILLPSTYTWLIPERLLMSHKKQYATSPGITLVSSETEEHSALPVTHDSVEDSTT